MYFKSKKVSLFILAVTAVACSKALFWLFNDPEGPNLLIVTGMALIIFAVSLLAYVFKFSTVGFKRLLVAVFFQIIITNVFYFLMTVF